MGDMSFDLEEMIGEDEFLEHEIESETLFDNRYTMEFMDRYEIHPGRSEIEEAIEKCSELPPEKIGGHYFLDSSLAEVHEAIDQVHEIPAEHEHQIRYLDPNE